MKPYTLLCIGCLFSWVTYAQEFKFFLNGSTVEDSTYVDSFQNGDLMRVLFSGKTTPYNFRIVTVMVTLIPKVGSANEALQQPTSFLLDNTSEEYTNYPSFTIDLMERLALLKHNDCDLSIKVHQLFADTQEGTDWIADNVKFKAVTIKRRDSGMARK